MSIDCEQCKNAATRHVWIGIARVTHRLEHILNDENPIDITDIDFGDYEPSEMEFFSARGEGYMCDTCTP